MRKTTLVLFIVLVLTLSLGAFAFQNEPEGFRGLKWEDPPGEDMGFFADIGISQVYIRAEEKLQLGDAQLELILYSFYQNRFMRVDLYFRGKKNYELLEKICRAKFGQQTDKELFSVHWFSLQTGVYLQYDIVEDEGNLGLSSWPIFKEYTDAMEAAQTEKAEGDW